MGFTELAIVIVLIIVIVFGGKKLIELSKSTNRVSAKFKKGKLEDGGKPKEMMTEDSSK